MSNLMEHNDDAPEQRDPTKEWVRERLVTRLYETLPPEEETKVEAYLSSHPELRDYEKKYREISRTLDELEGLEEPLTDDEIHTLVSAYQDGIEKPGAHLRSRVVRWLASAAVAASVLALIWSKGATVQIGETRITLGRVAQTATLEDELFREQITREVTTALTPYLVSLQDAQSRSIEAICQLVSRQREVDRQEIRNTIQKLVDVMGIMPRGRIALARPLFASGETADTERGTANQ